MKAEDLGMVEEVSPSVSIPGEVSESQGSTEATERPLKGDCGLQSPPFGGKHCWSINIPQSLRVEAWDLS